MFDIGWQEMFIVVLLAVIVIGPKDLPRAIKTVAKLVKKARGLARDFQDGFDEVVREAELDDLKQQVEKTGKLDIGKQIADHVDPSGDVSSTLNKDMLDIQKGLNEAGKSDDPPAAKMDTKAPKPSKDDKPSKEDKAD